MVLQSLEYGSIEDMKIYCYWESEKYQTSIRYPNQSITIPSISLHYTTAYHVRSSFRSPNRPSRPDHPNCTQQPYRSYWHH